MKVSRQIQQLVPYKPGKPIEETKREFGLETVYKLASNENPIGTSPKVREAIIKASDQLHRYPDPSCYELRQQLSKYYGVDGSWMAFGNGSNELIDLLIRIFCEPGESIATSESAFIAYKICAQAARVKTKEAAMTEGLKFDLSALAEQVKKDESIRLVFIANPNNPTGTYLNQTELTSFLDQFKDNREILIVLDEAYIEFVRATDYPQSRSLLENYPNVVLLRTLSKVYGLAGLRLGSLIARPETIDLIDRVRNPFNVNVLAQAAGLAAISDTEYLKKAQENNWTGLDYFYAQLENLSLPYWRSEANFVLFDTQRDSELVYQSLLKKGVIMRPVKGYGLPTHLRLSVGLPEENEAAMSALIQSLSEVPELKVR